MAPESRNKFGVLLFKPIGVGAGKIMGVWVWRNFAWILPNLPEKYFNISDLQKKNLGQFGRHVIYKKMFFISIRVPLFSNQSMLGAISAQIVKEFYKFLRDFPRFYWIFTISKLLEVRLHSLHPHLLHQCSNLRSFRSKCTVLKTVLATLLGLFSPRGIVPPSTHPWTQHYVLFFGYATMP